MNNNPVNGQGIGASSIKDSDRLFDNAVIIRQISVQEEILWSPLIFSLSNRKSSSMRINLIFKALSMAELIFKMAFTCYYSM